MSSVPRILMIEGENQFVKAVSDLSMCAGMCAPYININCFKNRLSRKSTFLSVFSYLLSQNISSAYIFFLKCQYPIPNIGRFFLALQSKVGLDSGCMQTNKAITMQSNPALNS